MWLCLCNNNRSTAVVTRNTRVCGLRTSSRQERPPAGRSPCPKTSSTPGSAAKAVHAVTELEDLFNGPSSVSREDAVSYDQLHVPISLPGDPMAMERVKFTYRSTATHVPFLFDNFLLQEAVKLLYTAFLRCWERPCRPVRWRLGVGAVRGVGVSE